MPCERPAQQRVGAEVFTDDRRVRAEIEHAPHAFDDRQQRPGIGEADLQTERRAGLEARHVDGAVRAIDGDGAPIAGVLDGLDAGCRARFRKASTASQS